jgi:hypothetical protein
VLGRKIERSVNASYDDLYHCDIDDDEKHSFVLLMTNSFDKRSCIDGKCDKNYVLCYLFYNCSKLNKHVTIVIYLNLTHGDKNDRHYIISVSNIFFLSKKTIPY